MNRTSSFEDVREQLGALLPQLRRFARVITRHVQDADDLVQVAIEKALTHADQWRPESRLDSWMFGIMKNAWIDEIRARGRRGRVLAPEEAGLDVELELHGNLVIEQARDAVVMLGRQRHHRRRNGILRVA